MKSFTFNQAEKNSGIVTNMPSTNVAWAIGNNVRFTPGRVSKTKGKALLASLPSVMPIKATFSFMGFDNVYRTIICSDSIIYAYKDNFTSHADITPVVPISSGLNVQYEFTLVGGILVITNGVDPVWIWSNYSGVLQPASILPTAVKHITSQGYRLIMGGTTSDGVFRKGRIMWTFPATPTQSAFDRKAKTGQFDLIDDSSGTEVFEDIQAFSSRGSNFNIYTKNNVFSATEQGTPRDYSFNKVSTQIGLMSSKMLVVVDGIDYFMDTNDFYVMGNPPQPIGFPIRDQVFPKLNQNVIPLNFAFYKPDTFEIWFCVALDSSLLPNTAFILDIETKGWSINDVDYNCQSLHWHKN